MKIIFYLLLFASFIEAQFISEYPSQPKYIPLHALEIDTLNQSLSDTISFYNFNKKIGYEYGEIMIYSRTLPDTFFVQSKETNYSDYNIQMVIISKETNRFYVGNFFPEEYRIWMHKKEDKNLRFIKWISRN